MAPQDSSWPQSPAGSSPGARCPALFTLHLSFTPATWALLPFLVATNAIPGATSTLLLLSTALQISA